MERSVLHVDGMMCAHCAGAVTKAVGALPGVGGVTVDLRAKMVTVEHDAEKSSLETIRAAIEDQGYDVL